MNRSTIGWSLIAIGWTSYLAALFCPAIEWYSSGLDMGGSVVTKSGAVCLGDTLRPTNWTFAPFLFWYALANFVLIGSPFAAAGPPMIRRMTGKLLLLSFAVTLTTPWCDNDLRRLLVGCYLWMASFACVGAGIFAISAADEQAGGVERRRRRKWRSWSSPFRW